MDTVTVKQAKELAYSFAQYSKVRVSELNTALDCDIAISSCRRLRNIQDATGVELAITLKRRIAQLESLKEML